MGAKLGEKLNTRDSTWNLFIYMNPKKYKLFKMGH